MSRNPFNWREYVQPFAAVNLVADSGHIHQDRHTMVYQPAEGRTLSKEERAKARVRAYDKTYKAKQYAKKIALRVNQHSDIGRTVGLTNSERAGR